MHISVELQILNRDLERLGIPGRPMTDEEERLFLIATFTIIGCSDPEGEADEFIRQSKKRKSDDR